MVRGQSQLPMFPNKRILLSGTRISKLTKSKVTGKENNNIQWVIRWWEGPLQSLLLSSQTQTHWLYGNNTIFAVGLRHLLYTIGHHSNFARCCLPAVIAIEPLAGHSSVLLSQLLLNYRTHGKTIQRTTVPAPMKLRKGWLHKMDHLVDLWLHLLILSPFQEFQTHSSPDLSPTSQSCSFHVPELAG